MLRHGVSARFVADMLSGQHCAVFSSDIAVRISARSITRRSSAGRSGRSRPPACTAAAAARQPTTRKERPVVVADQAHYAAALQRKRNPVQVRDWAVAYGQRDDRERLSAVTSRALRIFLR